MKKVLLAFLAAVTFSFAQAQLPSGSVCPDFTGTDLDGNTWNLYDLLDQGYAVVIDVSAAWCGPCWNYHNSGALENLYEEYGPDGTNEVMVFYIEGESANTVDQLNGVSTGETVADYSQGDWVTGTSYPIIDDATIGNLLEITYFPTIYTVCPSRIITETSQITTAEHYEFISESACQPASLSTDPALIGIQANGGTCDDASVEVWVTLQNFGTAAMTAATIQVTGGTSPVTYEWSGNLDTYEFAEVNVGMVNMSGSGTLTATITSTDGDPVNSNVNILAGLAETSTHFRLVINTDNWPEETGWEIHNSDGDLIASAAMGDYDGMEHETITEDVFVPSTGCYTVTLLDDYGDGIHGSQWGDVDGSFLVYGVDANGDPMSPIINYDGTYDYAELEKDGNATITVGVSELNIASGMNVYPNPTNGTLNLNYSIAGDAKVSVEVVDMLGSVVMIQNIGSVHTGTYTNQVDMSSLAAGLYMVNVKTNDVVNTIRVTVSK